MNADPISQNERMALGESWSPILNKYLSGQSDLIMPIIITIPIILSRLAQMAKFKKEKELKERYGLKDQPKEEKRKSNWSDLSFGKTDKE